MKEKELKKLNRVELLELLLEQTMENERLKEELDKVREELADRNLKIRGAGDLAHAVLSVNGVLEAAKAAADQYLYNMEVLKKDTETLCAEMLKQAREDAQRIRQEAVEKQEALNNKSSGRKDRIEAEETR